MSNVSRRSFVELAVGSLMSLPVLAGGIVLGPSAALAEESGNNDFKNLDMGQDAAAKYTVIDVVRPYEVAFIAIDVTKVVKDNLGNDTFERIKGKKVNVVVKSRYGDHKTAKGTTNEDGVVNIDVRQLAENPGKKDVSKLDSYAFNATLQVSCEGYRSFETSLVRVEGGTGLMVPLHPMDSEYAWPYRVSFDEWDILYTTNKFVQSPSLKDDHTIQVVAKNVAATSPVMIELWVNTESTPRQSVKATPASGEVTATFKGHFLETGHKDALPVGKAMKIILRDGATSYAWPIALGIKASVVKEPTKKENTKLKPFNTAGTSKPGIVPKWPKGVPIIGGGDLKFWTPDLPVGLYVNPFGYAQFTIKSPSWGYQNDNGEVAKSGWGKYPVKSVKDQWDRMLKTAKLMGDKTNALVSKPGGIQQLDLFKNFSLKANFQFVACAQWDAKKKLFQGSASGQILVAANATITENFFAGPIPVLITLAFDASFIAACTAACYSAAKKKDEDILDAIMDFGRWQWDYVNSGFTMTLNLTPSLSAGVGIRGVASVSVKGAVTLTLFLGIMAKEAQKKHPELPAPHFTAGWSAQITLVLHLFLFTETFVIKDFEFSTFYDNWKGLDSGVSTQADEMGTQATGTMDELLGGMSIITDEMLKSTVDVKLSALTTQGEGLQTQSEDETEPADWESRMEEVVIPLEDGTPMTYLVYSLGSNDKADDQKPEETTDDQKNAHSEDDGDVDVAQAGQPEDEAVVEQAEPADSTDGAKDLGGTEDREGIEGAASSDSELDPAVPAGPATQAEVATMAAQTTAMLVTQTSEPASDPAEEPLALEGERVTQPQEADTNAEVEVQEVVDPNGVEVEDVEATEGTNEERELEAQDASAAAGASGSWLTTQAEGGLVNPGVAKLGALGGVRPSSDIKVFNNVFGDPRAKVISIAAQINSGVENIHIDLKSTLCFRIGTVELADGKVRTRLIMNVVDGTDHGLSRVIEFNTNDSTHGVGINHADLYDYDFDLDLIGLDQKNAVGSGSMDFLAVALVSGRRSKGNDTTFADASTDLVFSCHMFRIFDLLGYDDSTGKKKDNLPATASPASNNMSFCMKGSQVTGTDESIVHSIASLQIVREGTSLMNAKWIISFLDRRGKTAADVMSHDKSRSEVRLGMAIYNFASRTFSPVKGDDINAKLGTIDDLSVFEHVLYPKIADKYTLMLRGSQKSFYYLVGLDTDAGAFSSATRCKDYDTSTRLVYWPGHDCFLLSYPTDTTQLGKAQGERDYSSWTLHKATWGTGATPELQMSAIGPQGFNIAAFALNQAGTFMFWPQAHEKDVDRVFNAMGEPDEKERPACYHIMACRLRKEKFSDPFIVADLPHDTDMLAVLGTGRGAAVEMLGTEFVKSGTMSKSGKAPLYYAANIWYSSVPGVRSATAVGCEAVSPFVSPGEKADFHVAVRNDGNVFLKGCKLTLCVRTEDGSGYERAKNKTGQVVASDITFSKDTIQESNWNHMANGALTGIESDYALAPGKTSVYVATVTIPEDWSGEKKVLFVASDGVRAEDGGLSVQADDGVTEVEFHVEPGEYQVIQSRMSPDDDYAQRYMDTISVMPVSAEDTFSQAPVETGPTVIPSSGSSAGVGTTNGGSSIASRQRTPNTGDSGGAVSAGLAALGAAALAYERRRARNNNE